MKRISNRRRRIPAATAAVFAAALAVGALGAGPVLAQHPAAEEPGPADTIVPTTEPISAADAGLWREDLEHLARGLVERHANAFHTIPADSFRAMVAALDRRIPTLARHEIIVEMIRIAAAIGDGHTNVPVLFGPANGFHSLPLRFGVYADGLYIEAGDRSLGDAVGARVVGFGADIDVETAIERLTPIVARDNDMWIRAMGPLLLARTEVLHALGLSDDPMRATLELERNGRRWTQTVDALPSPVRMVHGEGPTPVLTADWVDSRDTSPDTSPLHLKHPGRIYWWEHLPEHGLVYVHYGQVMNAPRGPTVREFFDEVFDFVEENAIDRLVLDVRYNSGGEGMLNLPVVRRLIASRVNRPGGLFVVTGPHTFSAAQEMVHRIERWTDAIFVGMPTGSSPQFYGDHSFFHLPNSGILVAASPTWWQPGGPYDDRPFLAPDVAAEPRFADYVANRDPAMDAIRGWDGRVTLEDRVLGAIGGGGSAVGHPPDADADTDADMDTDAVVSGVAADVGLDIDPAALEAAAAAVRAWSSDPANRYRSATSELNALGYRLLRAGRTEDALSVFGLNVRVYPEYANGWDSLGEGLLEAGRCEDALRAYRRALELDPRVGNAAEMVRRLGGGAGAPTPVSCEMVRH